MDSVHTRIVAAQNEQWCLKRGVSVLALVRGQVSLQVRALQEPLPADAAAVRPLARVAPQVFLQMSAVGEAFPAEGAAEGLLPRVNPHVYLQVSFSPTLFSTQGTAVQLHAGMPRHVLLQGGAAPAAFAADVAALGALVGVDVCDEVLGGLQRFSAHGAEDVRIPGMEAESVIYQELAG